VTRARLSPFQRSTLAAAAAAFLPLGAAADQTVQVGLGMIFSPASVTVAPGETVTWQFQELHTSTSDSQTGPEVWDSGFRSSGTFPHTFQTPGTYPYYCVIHSSPGGTAMNGVVVVSGVGATATPTTSPVITVTPTFTPGSPTATLTPVVTAILTPTSPSNGPTATPSPLATVTPTTEPGGPTATPIGGGAPASGIPDLDTGARILLALALGAIGFTILLLTQRR
jgi:plastocyanin